MQAFALCSEVCMSRTRRRRVRLLVEDTVHEKLFGPCWLNSPACGLFERVLEESAELFANQLHHLSLFGFLILGNQLEWSSSLFVGCECSLGLDRVFGFYFSLLFYR